MTDLDDLLDGPPRHLQRVSPPWAFGEYTVCGRPISDVKVSLAWEEAKALIVKLGQQRARFVFCQTCIAQQGRIKTPNSWRDDPTMVVHDYTRRNYPPDGGVRAELLALAQLVDAHRDEYTAIVLAHQTDEVTARRKRRATR